MVKLSRSLQLAVAVAVLLLASPELRAAETVGIVPFKVFGPVELQYLKDALPEMLASRLTVQKKAVLSKDALKKLLAGQDAQDEASLARTLMDKSGYGALVVGSYTRMGTAFSLDIRLHTAAAVQTASVSRDAEAKLFEAVDELTARIATMLGAPAPRVSTEPVFAATQQQTGRIKRLMVKEIPYQPGAGLCFADLDGDGKKELVLPGGGSIHAYRLEASGPVELFAHPVKREILSVDSWTDAKRNRDLLVVVTLDRGDPETLFLEASGNALKQIGSANWYVRAMDVPGRGPSLVGQRTSADSPFSGDLFYLELRDGAVHATGSLGMKQDVSLYQALPLTYRGKQGFAVLGDDYYLRFVNAEGKIVERTKDIYGGSQTGVEKGRTIDTSRFAPVHQRFWGLKDGESDAVLIVRNEGGASVLVKSRKYDAGRIALLRRADDGGYRETFVSETIDGYLAGLAMDPLTGRIVTSVMVDGEAGRIYLYEQPLRF